MEKAIKLLRSFISDKKVNWLQYDNRWDRNGRNVCKKYFDRNLTKEGNEPNLWDYGPYSYENAFKYRSFPQDEDKKMFPTFIHEELLNKSFVIDDFEISINYKESVDFVKSNYSAFGCTEVHHRTIYEYGVYMVYHGVHLLLGKYSTTYSIQADECTPAQSNWFHLKVTKSKPYVMKNVLVTLESHYYDKLPEFFKLIKPSDFELKKSKVPHQEWYDYKNKSGKSLNDLSLEQRDYKWFIESETKNGIYKPERSTIDRLLFSGKQNNRTYLSDLKFNSNQDKSILKKLKIHTIALRSDSHFDVAKQFNLSDIRVKAPKKVIELYGLEKFSIDEEQVKEIELEKKKKKEEQATIAFNNKFTLMQHGKVIYTDVDKEKIIDYLENFTPIAKDIETSIIKTVKPIFNEYDIDRIYIACWGTYTQYENRGSRKDIDYECFNLNSRIIEQDVWDEIETLFEENLTPHLDEKIIENKYGWPDDGFYVLGVDRVGKNKFKVFVEDYE